MNKRRVFGIITVIVIGLLAFAFANPNNNDNATDNQSLTSEELTTAKEKAIKDLESYVSEANYSVANWDLIEQIIIDGTDAINDATNQEEIDKALDDAKLLIDKIDTLAVELGAAKANAIKELNNYVLQANYSVNNWVLVQAEIAKGVAAINASTTIENVALELTSAKTAIDAISTLAEDLAAAKLAAINELNNYVLQANYSVNNWVLVQAEIVKGIAAINAVTVIENVTVELNNAKTLIDAISTLAEDLAAAKLVAISELNNYVLEADYSVNNWILVQAEIAKGIAAINAVTVIENVTVELNNAKILIDAISTLAEDLAAAKLVAINELNNYVLEKDYSVANWVLVQAEITKGVAAINASTTIKIVTLELASAKTAIDAISTLAEDLAAARKLAIDNLNKAIEDAEKINKTLYTDTSYNKLANLVEEVKDLDLDSKTTDEIINLTNEIITYMNELSGIVLDYITLSSNGKIYNRGDEVEEILVTAHYVDSTFTELVSANKDKEINTSSVVGDTEVVFAYNGESATYTYSVIRNEEDKKLASITASLDKTLYELGSNIYTLTVTSKDMDGTVTTLSNTDYDITNAFSTSTTGLKEIIVSYTKGEITATSSFSYNVVDTTKPSVSLTGEQTIILIRKWIPFNYYINYSDQGITIKDLSTTTISYTTSFARPYEIVSKVSNGINIGTEVGTYTITYTVTDASNNVSIITRTVKVKRNIDSSDDIDFDNVSNSKVQACKSCSFVDDKNVTAVDVFDDEWFHSEPLTVTSTNNVNMTKLGRYTVTYKATDWLGATKTVSREVRVVDEVDPSITLLNTTRKVNYNSKTTLDIKNYTVSDNFDNDILVNISYDIDSETICTKTFLGFCTKSYKNEYITKVIYEAKDDEGNTSKTSYKLTNKILINN